MPHYTVTKDLDGDEDVTKYGGSYFPFGMAKFQRAIISWIAIGYNNNTWICIFSIIAPYNLPFYCFFRLRHTMD